MHPLRIASRASVINQKTNYENQIYKLITNLNTFCKKYMQEQVKEVITTTN